MLSKWRWKLLQITRRLWVRASLIGAFAVVAALLAAVADNFIPWQVPGSIGADAVDDLLGIIASSMLAVTTFSLSVMTSAFGAATDNVTPRATRLLMQDQVTHNVLATFIGSFLFALVAIIMLKTGLYGDRGRVVLFIATIAVIALIVVTLLRWIDHLSGLGRVTETTNRVEEATRQAIAARLESRFLGGKAFDLRAGPPKGAKSISARTTGYVQHIDIQGLSECSDVAEADIYLGVLPGDFIHPDRPIVWVAVESGLDDDLADDIRDCLTIGTERSFDQDPRFGISVLSEIAMRALSPGVNDSGTAINVIGRMTRLLVQWSDDFVPQPNEEISFPRLHVPTIATADLFDDAFNLIARDGAALIEVQVSLQKALQALAGHANGEFGHCARVQAQLAMARAEQALAFEQDKLRLRQVAAGGAIVLG